MRSHWQERTRAAEDRLSDALHARLVQRFVDAAARRRTARRKKAADAAAAEATAPGARGAAPSSFAELLRAHVGATIAAGGGAPLASDARGAIDDDDAAASDRWVDELVDAGHARFRLDADGHINAGGERLARLGRGVDLLHPEIAIVAARPLGAGARLRLGRRLLAWSHDLVSHLLAPLRAGDHGHSGTVSPAVRGIVYQLEQGLGTIETAPAAAQLRELGAEDRAALRKLGVRVGRHVVFVPALLGADAVAARVALCNAQLGPGRGPGRGLAIPRPGAASLATDEDLPPAIYTSIGYPAFGARAIRADLVDGIAARLSGGARDGDIASRLGCRAAAVASVREALAGGRAPRGGTRTAL